MGKISLYKTIVEHCIIWGDLAETGGEKRAKRTWKLVGVGSFCPLCSYYHCFCRNCPLGNCNHYNSLYNKWRQCEQETSEKKQLALQIKEKALKWYEKEVKDGRG